MNDGEEERRSLRSSAASHTRRGTAVGSHYIALLLVLSLICFLSTFLTYHRILSPYVEGMSRSIDQPLLSDNNHDIISSSEIAVDDDKQLLFQPTAFHKHIGVRPYNYIHNNNFTHSSRSTFGKGINSNVRISFELHDPKVAPINNTFNPYVTCQVGMIFQGKGLRRKPTKEVRSGILPPSLMNVTQSGDYPREGRVLDFTATISTNLKILQIGDSVGVQLAQTFDEMVGCRNNVTSGFCRPRVVFSEAWQGHDSRSVMAPTIGMCEWPVYVTFLSIYLSI